MGRKNGVNKDKIWGCPMNFENENLARDLDIKGITITIVISYGLTCITLKESMGKNILNWFDSEFCC